MAEWLECRTCNSGALNLSPALTASWINFVLGSPEFKSLTTLVNNQLVCLWAAGNLNPVKFNLNNLFQVFAWPH